jgi:hypothetical protein
MGSYVLKYICDLAFLSHTQILQILGIHAMMKEIEEVGNISVSAFAPSNTEKETRQDSIRDLFVYPKIPNLCCLTFLRQYTFIVFGK